MAKSKKSEETTAPLNYEQQQAASGWLNLQRGAKVRLPPSEAQLFLQMRDQLDGEKLADGTPISTNLHVLRWLLSQVE